ncbi:hypothetical protein C0995_008858 [Termitomyces sp. Mi166|nr:hypothetical protein C0995_008858 [Termitomyces sp. Mi166\
MAVYLDEFTIQETFLDGISPEMRRALIFQHRLPAEQRPGLGPTGNAPVAKESQYMPGVGQPGPKGARDGLPRMSPPKVAFSSGDAGYKPSGGVSQCYNCGQTGHYAKDCKALRAQVQVAHMAAANSDVESNTEEDQEELVDNEEAPPEVEELEGDDDAESIHIDGDEYVAVDIYDNEYYAYDKKEEHLFALTEHQGDKRVHMQHVTLQKAADKLQ